MTHEGTNEINTAIRDIPIGNIVAFSQFPLNCRKSCIVYRLLASLVFFMFLIGYAKADIEPIVVEGRTMGTTYRVVYFDEPLRRDFKKQIDSLLLLVNRAINTYDPNSEISRFNKSEKGICPELPFLFDIVAIAKKVYKASGGAFDPTVMPLVNAWGFGPEKSVEPSAARIDSLKKLIGLKGVFRLGKSLRKRKAGIQLDMGGIGQGYGADVVFTFLRSKGIDNLLVELGGEGIASGKNLQKDKPWTIGILDPNSTPDHQFFKAYVTLHDQAFTTSGNYFNYKIIDGRKFGHTIDPATGYPAQHSLLSASVFADDCTIADAWATAFMVMGLEEAIEKVQALKNVDALFMYSTAEGEVMTWMTKDIERQVTIE